MIQIDYPENTLKIRNDGRRQLIFDEVRKKWLVLTPEEWVRQNIIQYLIKSMKYPLPLLAVEKLVRLAEVKKRFDIVVYKNSKPWMMIECKEQNIPLSENVLEQLINYHMALPTRYLVITNGNAHYGLEKTEKGLLPLHQLPDYFV